MNCWSGNEHHVKLSAQFTFSKVAMEKSFYCYLIQEKSGAMTLHIQGCLHMDNSNRRIFLGSIYQKYQAVNLAKKYSSEISLCPYCMGK